MTHLADASGDIVMPYRSVEIMDPEYPVAVYIISDDQEYDEVARLLRKTAADLDTYGYRYMQDETSHELRG